MHRLKLLFIISLVTVPLSFISNEFIDSILKNMLGGQASLSGFPIRYYYDLWETSDVEFNMPFLRYVNWAIYYSIYTFFAYLVFQSKATKN